MSLFARILLFVVIVAAIACSSIWLIGGKKNDFSTSLVINAQPQQIFPYLTESDRLKQWISGLVRVEDLAMAEKNQPAVITERIVDDGQGNSIVFKDKVIRQVQDELFSVQSTSSEKVITAIYQLEPTDDQKTQLTCRFKEVNTSLGRFLAPF